MNSQHCNNDLHEEMLILLKRFDDICCCHGIKYSLHGGTLLGAIREKGFIPWDDDIDITITRDNYEKLKNSLQNDKSTSDLIFDEHFTSAPIIWMCRKGHIPVWIDVLIYDYISEHFVSQKLKFLGMVFFLGITKSQEGMKITRLGEYKGIKYMIIFLLYFIGRFFSNKAKKRWQDQFGKKFFIGSKKYMVRSNDQYKALGLIIPTNAIVEYIRVPFEDISLMVHKGYDEILVSSYGKDYMKPVKNTDTAAIEADLIRLRGINLQKQHIC